MSPATLDLDLSLARELTVTVGWCSPRETTLVSPSLRVLELDTGSESPFRLFLELCRLPHLPRFTFSWLDDNSSLLLHSHTLRWADLGADLVALTLHSVSQYVDQADLDLVAASFFTVDASGTPTGERDSTRSEENGSLTILPLRRRRFDLCCGEYYEASKDDQDDLSRALLTLITLQNTATFTSRGNVASSAASGASSVTSRAAGAVSSGVSAASSAAAAATSRPASSASKIGASFVGAVAGVVGLVALA